MPGRVGPRRGPSTRPVFAIARLRQGYEEEDGRGFTNVSGDMTLKIGLTFRF